MPGSRLVLMNWWRSDRKILYIFALYGLAAGIMTSALSLYNDNNLTYLVRQLNFPAMMIVGSMAAWSFIGLLIYSLVRMFRMGP